MHDIVIDTNVLLSGMRSRRGASFSLLSLIGGNSFRVHISTPLVAEYEAVLKRGMLELSEAEIDDVIDYLCVSATAHEIFYLWRPVLKDPDDDFLLELAVKANASIVTWNLTDFKKAAGLNVVVMNPPDFLRLLEN